MLCLLSLNGSNYLLGGRQHQLPSPTPDFLAMVQAGMDPQTVCLSLLLNHLLTTLLPLQDPQEPSPSASNCRPPPKMPHASRQGTMCHELKQGTEAIHHAKSDGDTMATQPWTDAHPDSSKGMDLTLESKVIFFLYYYFTHALSFSIQVVMTWCSKSHT
jgi:hypothetical protein